MNSAGHGQTVFDLFIDDAVTADDDCAAFFDLIGAAFENFSQDLDVHLSFWKADEVQACLGLAAHGVDVAEGIRRRDLPEGIRVIDNRREEIDCVDDGEVRSQAKYSGVVGRLRPDQHVRVVELWQIVQNLHEVGWAELSGSTRGFDRLRQPNGLFLSDHHRLVSVVRSQTQFNALSHAFLWPKRISGAEHRRPSESHLLDRNIPIVQWYTSGSNPAGHEMWQPKFHPSRRGACKAGF